MTEMELAPPQEAAGLFKTDEPDQIIQRATETADRLADVIRKQKLAVTISKREHVRVEGWTLLGTLLGVFPYTVWTRPIEGGWEARCEARTLNGNLVGAAEAQCTKTEPVWRSRDDYAIRSMAQTRATSKALRQPLGFVMALAGFDPTPAEEMPRDVQLRQKVVLGPEHAAPPAPEPGPDFGPINDPDLEPDENNPFKPPAIREGTDRPPATAPQAKKIWALMNKLATTERPGYDIDSLRHQLGLEFGTEDPRELHRDQAREVIDRLLKREQELGLG